MRSRPFLLAAAIAVLLAATAPAPAADTIKLLGGVGAANSHLADDAAVITLKGTAAAADTVQTGFYHRHYYGGYRHYWGGGYRPYWGGYRPYYGGYRPYWGGGYRQYWGGYRPYWGGYRPYYWGGYRPYWGGYRPYWGGGYYRPYGGIGVAGYASAPAYNYGYGVTTTVAAAAPVTTLALSAPASETIPTPPWKGETLPAPRPTDGFRYDGGPARPVPMPGGTPGPMIEIQPKPITPPITPPNVTGLTVSPKKKLTYPAYGERPAPPAFSPARTNLVKATNQ